MASIPRMSRISMILSRAIDRGRSKRPVATRAGVLEALLRKRAAAQVHGAHDLENLLREQIRWSLPMRRLDDPKK